VAGIVFDSSILVAALNGETIRSVEDAMSEGTGVLPPLVVSELISGAQSADAHRAIGELLQEAPLHDTPLQHWIAVGELRRRLRSKGLVVSTPDAHIAQCALDRNAILLTRDAIFRRMARHIPLRVAE
jgi:predicted nucleic acid-binding protein